MSDDFRIAAGINTDGQVELTVQGDPSHTMNLDIEEAEKIHRALGVAIAALGDNPERGEMTSSHE